MSSFRTIILAAGQGVRMNSELPKVLHPVCGRPMVRHVIDVARSLGSSKNYVVLGYKSELVKKELDKSCIVVIQKKLLGTADAIRSTQSHFKSYAGNILVLCGDTPLLTQGTVRKLIDAQTRSKDACTVLTAVIKDPKGYGRIIRNASRQMVAIREDVEASPEEKNIREINTGVYCFKSRELFATLKAIKKSPLKKEFFLTDIFKIFIAKGLSLQTVVAEDPSETMGINTRVELAAANATMRKKILRQLMLSGVTIEDPETTYVDHNVSIGRDTIIRPGTVIDGPAKIGLRCVIGPYSHIRPDSVIGNDVVVGNFAEVSRSSLGEGTLVKHFSFVGDATIGRKVNIGAGVVTANYDGKNKNKTAISDGAFIGSDSILVAPVSIGKKSVTGAGAVVTKGTKVPANGIVVGVPAKLKSRRI